MHLSWGKFSLRLASRAWMVFTHRMHVCFFCMSYPKCKIFHGPLIGRAYFHTECKHHAVNKWVRSIPLRTNGPTSHHVRAQQATPTTINDDAWQARYLCLSVPINVYKREVTYTGLCNQYPVTHLEVYAKPPLSFSWKAWWGEDRHHWRMAPFFPVKAFGKFILPCYCCKFKLRPVWRLLIRAFRIQTIQKCKKSHPFCSICTI